MKQNCLLLFSVIFPVPCANLTLTKRIIDLLYIFQKSGPKVPPQFDDIVFFDILDK